jgi:uncharacterized protein (TIGR02145 family)
LYFTHKPKGNTMKTRLTKLVLVATFVLAFSCSSNNDDTGSSSSSNGGSGLSSFGGGGSSSSLTGTSGIFVDSRDTKPYKWVKIDQLIWFAENLNYVIEGGKCYGEGGKVFYDIDVYITLSPAEIQANCDKYGRLYDWATAMGIEAKYNKEEWGESDVKHQGICPAGWHIPNSEEWRSLFRYAGMVSSKLKSKNGWTDIDGSDVSGTDDYGFSALPGGRGRPDGTFYVAGYYGHWWISTEFDKNSILVWYMAYYGDNADQYSALFEKNLLHSVRCVKD